MNNPTPISPLVPQGSLLEQKNKGRAKVKIAVFFVLAIHGIGLLALLMQGCGREKTTVSTEATNTVATPDFQPTNPPMVDTSTIAAAASNAVPDLTVPPPAAPTEYTIVTGDSFSKLATRFHV